MTGAEIAALAGTLLGAVAQAIVSGVTAKETPEQIIARAQQALADSGAELQAAEKAEKDLIDGGG